MGELIRAHDWRSTLGAPDTWSRSLRTVVRLMLTTNHPVFMFWGPDRICLYNDAYSPSLGPEMHPSMLGAPGRVVWQEIWTTINPQIETAMSGGASWHVDQCIPFVRRGHREEVYWTYSFSPIDDDTVESGVGGVLVICAETTQRVMTMKLQSFRLRLEAALLDLENPREIFAVGTRLLGEFLQATRCGFGEIDASSECLIVRCDWSNGVATSLAGHVPLYEFGPQFVSHHHDAGIIAVEDPLPEAPDRTLSVVYSSRSDALPGLAAPLVKNGHFVAALYVYRNEGMHWNEQHKSLLREVAERLWCAVERSRVAIERERICAGVRDSEARYRSLVESSAAIVWEMPASGEFATPQAGWSVFTGQSFEEQKGWGWLNAVHCEDQDLATDAIGRAFEASSDFQIEYRLRDREGEYRPMFVRAAAVMNTDGSLRGWVGVHRNLA